jgi:hypothetical protein
MTQITETNALPELLREVSAEHAHQSLFSTESKNASAARDRTGSDPI